MLIHRKHITHTTGFCWQPFAVITAKLHVWSVASPMWLTYKCKLDFECPFTVRALLTVELQQPSSSSSKHLSSRCDNFPHRQVACFGTAHHLADLSFTHSFSCFCGIHSWEMLALRHSLTCFKVCLVSFYHGTVHYKAAVLGSWSYPFRWYGQSVQTELSKSWLQC